MIRRMRMPTRQIQVGGVKVGGGAPISIQTMAKADPADIEKIIEQLREAKEAGCDIARIAVPNLAAAQSIPKIKEGTGLPIVADIHFDAGLAVEAAKCGADGLRINPGNIGGEKALRAVVEAAGKAGIPLRVGVNGGSMPKQEGEPIQATAESMVRAALDKVAPIEAMGFHALKVSLKAFDVATTVEANRLFTRQSDLPLHLGVTEAGPPLAGAVRSVAALAPLLSEGIGDTLRISLTASPVLEVRAARFLLLALRLREGGVVVSCPTCGRTGVDLVPVAERVEKQLLSSKLDLVVAVMGCEVNGPGEARAADVGIAYGPKGEGLLFEQGKISCRLSNEALEGALCERLLQRSHGKGHGT
jgi:(E)-4-hydroxy-3-methylbut-2-enyl-diphosphate synthase